MTEPQQYCLKWNNYLRALTLALDNHRQQDHFVDVTLLCEGRKIKAHKIVLSSCSSYFKEILSECSHPHPLLIFNFMKYDDLNLIIQFMYQGEISVHQEGLQSLLEVAKLLQVHGLNMDGEYNQFTSTNTSSTDSNNVSEDVAVPKSIPTNSSATNTETQNKMQINGAEENVALKNLPSIDDTSTHATPSCSQASCKKRKLADSDDNAANDQTTGNAGAFVIKMSNSSENILGQRNIYESTTDVLQEINHNLEPDTSIIKTELDMCDELNTEESHTLINNDEMTIESRRLTNPSTPYKEASLDLTPSCSSFTTTENKGCRTLRNKSKNIWSSEENEAAKLDKKFQRTTKAQLQCYNAFLKEHPELKSGSRRLVHQRRVEELWEEVAESLNSLEGATRTPNKWKMSLAKWKSQLRIRTRKLKEKGD